MSYRIDTQITIDEVKLYSCEISVEKYAKPAKKINDTSTIIKDGLKIIFIPLKLNRMKIHHALYMVICFRSLTGAASVNAAEKNSVEMNKF
ncbi:MAG: hypothetical protein IPO98_11910 [Saprospiraceae bacterium]|nr:hypothetical protein [Saprospiraceae bacterium]